MYNKEGKLIISNRKCEVEILKDTITQLTKEIEKMHLEKKELEEKNKEYEKKILIIRNLI